MARTLALLTTMAMLAMALAWAGDEALPDPTLPPASAMKAATAAGGNAAPPAPVLHTVILREGAKPIAVIGDQQVELGARFGEAKLVKVSAGEVVLIGPGGKQVLRLMPEVSKTAAKEKSKRDKQGGAEK